MIYKWSLNGDDIVYGNLEPSDDNEDDDNYGSDDDWDFDDLP